MNSRVKIPGRAKLGALMLVALNVLFVNSVQADVLFVSPAASTAAGGLPDTLGDSLDYKGTTYPLDMVVGDFTLGAGSVVSSVQFTGSYGFNGRPTSAPDAFLVNFYADNNGVPGALLSSQSLTNIVRTSLAPASTGSITNPAAYADVFTGTLSASLDLSAGSYFFGLSEVASPSPGNWEWNLGGAGTSYLLDSSSANYDVLPATGTSDLAFELDGVAVPEPSVLGCGLFALGLFFGSRLCAGAGIRLRRHSLS